MITKNLQFGLIQTDLGLELEISNDTARAIHNIYAEVSDVLTQSGLEKTEFFDFFNSETKNNLYDFLKNVLAEYAMQTFLKNLLEKKSDIPTVRIEEKHLYAFYRFLQETNSFFNKSAEGSLGADVTANIHSLKEKIAYFFAERYLLMKNV